MEQKICRYCGQVLTAQDKVCPTCGSRTAKPIWANTWFWAAAALVGYAALKYAGLAG